VAVARRQLPHHGPGDCRDRSNCRVADARLQIFGVLHRLVEHLQGDAYANAQQQSRREGERQGYAQLRRGWPGWDRGVVHEPRVGDVQLILVRDLLIALQVAFIDFAAGGGLALKLTQAHAFRRVVRERAGSLRQRVLQGLQTGARDRYLIGQVPRDALDFPLDLRFEFHALGAHRLHRGVGFQVAVL